MTFDDILQSPGTTADNEPFSASDDGERRVETGRRARRPRLPGAALIGLILTLALSAGMALYSLSISTTTLDADEAVTGVMAHRILTGQQQYIFFTSQSYNGSLEQYLQAAMYAVTHLPENPFTLRLVQVALSVLTTFVIYLVGRLIMQRPWAAVLAAALYAAGPYYRIWLGTRSYGSYDTTQLFSLLGVYFALRAGGFIKGRQRIEPAKWAVALWLGLVGLCLGLCLWLGLSGLEVFVPVMVWLIPTIVRSWRGVVTGVIGILIGALPLLYWIARHHAIPGLGGSEPPTTLDVRAHILYGFVARQFLGLQVALSGQFPRPFILFVLFVAVLLVVVGVVVRFRGLFGVITFRMTPRRPGDLILLILPVGVAIYLLSTFSWYRGAPRYLFMLYPMVALGVAMVFHAVWSYRNWPAFRVGVALSAVVVLALGVGFTHQQLQRNLSGSRGFTTDAQLTAADNYMAAHGMKDAYTQYWGALPMQYFAGDEVTISPWGVGSSKSDPSRTIVDAAPHFVYLSTFRMGLPTDQQLQAALKAHGVTYKAIHLAGNITIYADLSQELRPAQLGLNN